MVSLRSAIKPLKLIPKVITSPSISEKVGQAEEYYQTKKYRRAMKIYQEIQQSFDESSPSSTACKFVMESNVLKMKALEYIRTRRKTKEIHFVFEEIKGSLQKALDHEPYWAEYRENYAKLDKYIHDTFGCIIDRKNGEWVNFCGRVCRELGLIGISPGMTMRIECSICGKDPIDCEHIAGEIYDGYLALHVAKDMSFDHIALVGLPAQRDTYIQPKPLSDAVLEKCLTKKIARKAISESYLTCKSIVPAIRRNGLKGMYWKPA